MSQPLRGEVWLVMLDPTIGREQAGTRPALVISDDLFNQSHAELVVVLPITSKSKGIRSHVPVSPPEGGLQVLSLKWQLVARLLVFVTGAHAIQ